MLIDKNILDYIEKVMLFKNQNDKDFKPDFSNPFTAKFSVAYNLSRNYFETVITFDMYRPSDVYFSSEKIAASCAEWLNTEIENNKEEFS